MPLYTAITQDPLPHETKARIAKEITRIHSTVMKVPSSFVHVIFLSYPQGSGFTAGKDGSPEAVVVDVPKPERSIHRSTGNFSARDTLKPRHGDGPDHAGGHQMM